ncbi:MAG TPA: nicotinate-nucleotide adenylyltransferase [Gelria sp.]|jgi:nicotinate-nucleotide adenylyltransferase|nr:nicotinate-nucleotide adenylyltransferase [Gelria sp.]
MQRFDSIGIMGGTFDPVHYGHLIAAEFARHEFKLDSVIFMPAARPPHKEINEVLDSEHRYNMVKIAIRGNPALTISDLEMKRAGKSYTIDTVRYFLKHYSDSDIFFIMGADSLLTMHTWKDYQELSGLCRFVVATRPGYIIERSDPALKNLPSILWERMDFLPIPGLDISSTNIRQRVAENRPIKYLLPLEVEQYILDKGLYREKEGVKDVK